MEDKKSLNVLVVDNNYFIRTFYSSILTRLKIKYKTANDGLEGFEKYIKNSENDRFNLVLSDINMPFMKGDRMTLKIREYEKKNNLYPAKIYSISKYNKYLDKNSSRNPGFNDCFYKRDLYGIISKILNT
ncbi:MAG: response regulator [Nanoarchaeota archaeon]